MTRRPEPGQALDDFTGRVEQKRGINIAVLGRWRASSLHVRGRPQVYSVRRWPRTACKPVMVGPLTYRMGFMRSGIPGSSGIWREDCWAEGAGGLVNDYIARLKMTTYTLRVSIYIFYIYFHLILVTFCRIPVIISNKEKKMHRVCRSRVYVLCYCIV